MPKLTDEEQAVVVRVLKSIEVQNLIGGEEWDLSEEEENILWRIIKQLP